MPHPHFYCLHVSVSVSINLLRVALLAADARCTPVQLRFSASIAAARDGFSQPLFISLLSGKRQTQD